MFVVRLACVKHLDSVQSEPSSNSTFFFITDLSANDKAKIAYYFAEFTANISNLLILILLIDYLAELSANVRITLTYIQT